MTRIEPIFSAEEITSTIETLADRLTPQLQIGQWHVVTILLGAMPFSCALMDALGQRNIHPILDALWLSSYGDAQSSSGKVRVRADLSRPIKDRNVLILDELCDSGDTLTFARQHCLAKGAKNVLSCALLKKPLGDPASVDAYGLDAPNAFLVGFGLDDAGKYRGLPYVGSLENP